MSAPHRWQIFEGANGFYLAVPDAHGFHHAPDTERHADSAWYATREDAEEARQVRERDLAAWDAWGEDADEEDR